MAEVIKITYQLRRGKKEAWERNNPILAVGEPGFVTDKYLLKIGDGITPWNDLPYINGENVIVEEITEVTEAVENITNLLGDAETEGTLIYRTESLEREIKVLDEAIANSDEVELSNIGTEEEPVYAFRIKRVNVNKLVQNEGEFLVLYGGSASDNI